LVDLGDFAIIEQVRRRFVAALAEPASNEVRQAGHDLHQLIMKPLYNVLGGTRSLIVAPDATLNLLPMGALVDDGGKWLLESYRLTYVASGRDLLRMQWTPIPVSDDVVVANPAFGDSGAAIPDGARARQGRAVFEPLPGTAKEAQAIAALFPDATLLEGAGATEKTVKRVRGPRILHLATHGFVAVAPHTSSTTSRGMKLSKSAVTAKVGVDNDSRQMVSPADALLHAGVALAGANQGGSAGEDGILTAAEMSGMDLWGTNLVVLSACETGLGALSLGEGVLGLRRALVMSGSQTQVMSLWSVDDVSTQHLMAEYYRLLLSSHGRAEALRQAQLRLLLDQVTAHPYHWAAFISVGDWRPIYRK
jgi:CHAT domain-containing protein